MNTTKDWELNHNEIDLAIKSAEELGYFNNSWGCYEIVAKAAQRKLVEWLHEKCYKHDAGLLRRGCPECLRELRKEFGL